MRPLPRRLLPALLALLVPLAGLRAAEPPPLRIGTLEDRALAASTEKALQEAYRRAGLRIEFQPLPLRRAALLLKEGQIDGDFIRSPAFFETYPELVKVGVPVRHLSYWVHRRPPCARSIDFAELGRSRVAYLMGAAVIESQLPEAARVPVAQTWDLLGLVREGRAQYSVMPMTPALLAVAGRDYPELCHIQLPLLSIDLFHALASRHAALRPRLEAALLSMQRDGTLERIWAAAEPRLRAWSASGPPRPASAPRP